MSITHRDNDAVITICQNNNDKTITIHGINQAACALTGYYGEDVVGQKIEKFLPNRIAELLHEYVEFSYNANDVGEVLGRVRSFSMLDRNGAEHAYKIKILQTDSGHGSLFFSLVLRDSMEERKDDAMHSVIQENFKGHETIDSLYGLPDRASIAKNIDIVKSYTNSGNVASCFGVLQIDAAGDLKEKYGTEVFVNVIKHSAFIARQSLREYDVLGSIGDGRIGVLLVGVNYSSAKMIFNRLRWQIAANPYQTVDNSTLGTTVSIIFSKI